VAIVVALVAVSLSGWIVSRAVTVTVDVRSASGTTGTVPATVGAVPLVALALGVVALVLIGTRAVRHGNEHVLWTSTGGLLLLGIAPFAQFEQLLIVGVCVAVGVLTVRLPRDWYHGWFLLGLLVPLWGIGALVYVQIPGYLGVMTAAGCAIVFGVAVIAVGFGGSTDRSYPPDATLETALRDAITRRSVAPLRPGIAAGPEWQRVWIVVAIWSIVVTVLHFSSLGIGLYSRYWWWDLFTHGSSGFGVAAILYLLRPETFGTRRQVVLGLTGLVLVIGAAFEVYEYVFRSYFFQPWTPGKYLHDTVLDMVVNTAGGFLFAVAVAARLLERLRLRRQALDRTHE
jgi:hypothetical protein